MFKKRNINKSTRREKFIEESNNVDNDDDSTISDTIEEKHLIRKLKRQAAGIDSEKLVQTTSNSKKPKLDNSQSKEAHGWSASSGGIVDNTEKLKEASNPQDKLVKTSNFTGQSATIDVDKHMMSYIEEQMLKKHQQQGLPTDNLNLGITNERINNPQDELYDIAQKYTYKSRNLDDGSITNSESMLTKIPEVDLGVEAKLRNIQETEKAKQRMRDLEKHTSRKPANTDPDYTQTRFMQPSLARSRIDTTSLEPLKQEDAVNDYRQQGKASDKDHYTRFRSAMSKK
ncbi:hypothetical protein E3Q24_03172 [Wallemia mellicola]|nr:hypothetical protein E3Q24_03172 [Wallemia mellicola]